MLPESVIEASARLAYVALATRKRYLIYDARSAWKEFVCMLLGARGFIGTLSMRIHSRANLAHFLGCRKNYSDPIAACDVFFLNYGTSCAGTVLLLALFS